MRRIDLDFERRPGANALAYLVLVVGAALAVSVGGQYQSVTAELQAQDAVLRQLHGSPRQRASSDPRTQRERDERMAGAAVVLDELGIPWDALFKGLESADEPDVALLSVSPDAAKQQIKLVLEAKNLAGMLAYHAKLDRVPIFAEVSLAQHEIAQQDPNRPVRFTISARWTGTKASRAAQ